MHHHLIRAAGLSGYGTLAASLGLDVAGQLRRAGLPMAALHDPELLIPYPAMIDLLEHSAADAGCSDFGLRLSLRQGIEILGPMAIAIEHASTLGEAVALAAQYMYVHSPAIRLSLQPAGGQPQQVDLCIAIELADTPASVQAIELALGVLVRSVRLLGRGAVRQRLLRLPHGRVSALAIYEQILGARCSFEQSEAAVRLDAAELSVALPRGNPMIRKLAQTYIDTHFTSPDQTFTDRVRLLLRQLMGTGRASQQAVASMLDMHPRMLQRRLSEEGAVFETIKDDMRRRLFEQLLQRPEMPRLDVLADLLDYADASTLTRSCHRWFGVSPSQLRRQLQAASRRDLRP